MLILEAVDSAKNYIFEAVFLVGPKQCQVSDSLLVPQCHIMSLNFRASRWGFGKKYKVV